MNIKKIILSLLIIVSIFSSHRSYAGFGSAVGSEAAEISAEALKQVAGMILQAAPHLGENTARELANALIILSPDLAHKGMEEMAHAIATAAPNIGREATKNIADATVQSADKIAAIGEKALVVIGGVTIALKTFEMAKDLINYMNPSEEEQKNENAAREFNEAYKAKKEFRDCLMKNHTAERNEFGRPKPCEGFARTFAMMNSKLGLDEMTRTLNELYGKNND